jgi:hypothetical protein
MNCLDQDICAIMNSWEWMSCTVCACSWLCIEAVEQSYQMNSYRCW